MPKTENVHEGCEPRRKSSSDYKTRFRERFGEVYFSHEYKGARVSGKDDKDILDFIEEEKGLSRKEGVQAVAHTMEEFKHAWEEHGRAEERKNLKEKVENMGEYHAGLCGKEGCHFNVLEFDLLKTLSDSSEVELCNPLTGTVWEERPDDVITDEDWESDLQEETECDCNFGHKDIHLKDCYKPRTEELPTLVIEKDGKQYEWEETEKEGASFSGREEEGKAKLGAKIHKITNRTLNRALTTAEYKKLIELIGEAFRFGENTTTPTGGEKKCCAGFWRNPCPIHGVFPQEIGQEQEDIRREKTNQ